eukprot:c31999_g1_i1 orf=41-232(+)
MSYVVRIALVLAMLVLADKMLWRTIRAASCQNKAAKVVVGIDHYSSNTIRHGKFMQEFDDEFR